MPTYQYACRDCGHRLEAVQSFSDEPLTMCPVCGGALRKVFSAVGVVFKGSGFYRTDSRAKPGGAKADTGAASAGGEASGSSAGSSDGGTAPAAGGAGKKGDTTASSPAKSA